MSARPARRRTAPVRASAVVALMTVAPLALASIAGCGARADDADAGSTTPNGTTATAAAGTTADGSGTPGSAATTTARAREELAYLGDLDRRGVGSQSAEGTLVELGHGVCRSLSSGADPQAAAERLRPVARALAARAPGDADATAIARELVDSARTHLCPR